MANAKISIPGGVSVDLEGTADEVVAVLENLRKNYAVSGTAVPRSVGGPAKGKGEIPRLIDSLKSEDYFRTPRGLSERPEEACRNRSSLPTDNTFRRDGFSEP